ncbi:YncE family protein [uncultured Bacteroides sp.]|uniref:YncE family protein n=1 Tax=uncultured Bacteroides sp. TaxID=162156 RepID=UPI00280AD05B|nr:YncE family protein [uncultured Bacteroides sp.]
MKKIHFIYLLILFMSLSACREDEQIFLSDSVQVALPMVGTRIKGFYQLNEGNMGMNRASLDYFDYTTGHYTRDIFSERNPEIVKELGDVGNDIKVYGQKVYAVINVSNLIVVFDVRTARRIKEIEVPNCRYLAFWKDKAYISSYAGPVQIDPNAEVGFVAEIDTASLEVTRKVPVGYQPEEMVVHNKKLYVANSGGYRAPNYDRTVSVIDLETFEEEKKIDVAINLYRMAIDERGDIYVSSRGDYKNTPSNLYVIDSTTDEVKQCLDIPVGGMCIDGDKLYYYSVAYSMTSGGNKVTYGILDTRTKRQITDRIITDGTDKDIMIPYGIAVNPETKEIFMSDAQNYVVTGFVYCFSPEGKLKWKTEGGNIPGHFAFITESLIK